MKLPDKFKNQTTISNYQIESISRCKLVNGYVKVKIFLRGQKSSEFPHGDTWLSLRQLDEKAQDRALEHIINSGFYEK